MRIGIDIRTLSFPQKTGIGNYIFNILTNLAQLDQLNEYYLYSHKDFDLPLFNTNWHIRIGKTRILNNSTIWLQTEAVKMILKDKIDLFWGPNFVYPLFLPKKIKKIITVHDLVWLLYPNTQNWRARLFIRYLYKISIKKADHIICVSESTAKDLKSILNIPEGKIDLIYGATTDYLKPYDKNYARKFIAEKYKVPENFILTVSTIEPRKNLTTLFKAIDILDKTKDFPYQLIVIGKRGYKAESILKSIKNIGVDTKIRLLGYVHDKDLPMFYSAARIFVYPSIYEGFGLPLLEAMACGTPVITTNSSSLPEVIGDAGILIEPYNINRFARAIYELTTNNKLNNTYIQKGLERVKIFSWMKSAKSTLNVFKKIFHS